MAVPLPDRVRVLLGEIQDELEPLALPFRWADPWQAHITLKFYGDTPVRSIRNLSEKLAWAAGRFEPIKLQTGRIGAFPNTRRPRVVWLGLDGNVLDLERLAEDVDEVSSELGFEKERKRFRGHITVGRLRNRAEPPDDFDAIVAGIGLPSVPMTVDRLQLIRSVLTPAGPDYAVIDEWRLGASARAPRSLEYG